MFEQVTTHRKLILLTMTALLPLLIVPGSESVALQNPFTPEWLNSANQISVGTWLAMGAFVLTLIVLTGAFTVWLSQKGQTSKDQAQAKFTTTITDMLQKEQERSQTIVQESKATVLELTNGFRSDMQAAIEAMTVQQTNHRVDMEGITGQLGMQVGILEAIYTDGQKSNSVLRHIDESLGTVNTNTATVGERLHHDTRKMLYRHIDLMGTKLIEHLTRQAETLLRLEIQNRSLQHVLLTTLNTKGISDETLQQILHATPGDTVPAVLYGSPDDGAGGNPVQSGTDRD